MARTKQFIFRLTEPELRALMGAADFKELSASEFVRQAIAVKIDEARAEFMAQRRAAQ